MTPIPKPRKRKGEAEQRALVFDEGKGLSSEEQQYQATASVINQLRGEIEVWRNLKNPNDWLVTPETARLLQHWRHHQFSSQRPFFCQIEAVETAIYLNLEDMRLRPFRPFWGRFAAVHRRRNDGRSLR